MKKILVLGGSGMLGAMVVDCLSHETGLEVTATVRNSSLADICGDRIPNVRWRLFNVENSDLGGDDLFSGRYEWIINTIGVIKPYIRDNVPLSVENAIRVNALFPHRLAEAVGKSRTQVIQIATDCVYSGKEGNYQEDAPHDSTDVYGKTKSLGEVPSNGMYHIRCSIIGPEPKGHVSLLDWFRGQPHGAEVTGFTNHRWNGVTTLQFAKICAGIIREKPDLPLRQHLVPRDDMTKAGMLETFSTIFDRKDITIRKGSAHTVVDRTLRTSCTDVNRKIWLAAGYSEPPTVMEMIDEMGRFPFRLASLQ